MRLVTLCLIAAGLLVGCGDEPSKVPLANDDPKKAQPPLRADYKMSDVVGTYRAKLMADADKPDQSRLLGIASAWTLNLTDDGRFKMELISPREGSYTVTGNILVLAVEKHDNVSLRQLEKMAKEQGKPTDFIDKMRMLEFRILDDGKNLLAMKGNEIEPGAFMFERD